MSSAVTGKIVPLRDEEGNKLPKNLSTQFRNVQSGIEHLKGAADEITVELKGVNNKLGANTSDLKLITKKINEIEKRQIDHMNITKQSIGNIEKLTQSVVNLLVNIENRVNNLEKNK